VNDDINSVNEEDKFKIKDGYLYFYPTNSQKIFLLEGIHFVMKTFIRRDIITSGDILDVHRLSRMWLELNDSGSITLISHEDAILLSLLRQHWSGKNLNEFIKIHIRELKNDNSLIVAADHAVKAMAQIMDT
jgi:hypothetical protein